MAGDRGADGEPLGTEFEDRSADEAFAVLGNPTRIEILEALWEARGPQVFDPDSSEHTLRFSELYDHVDYDTPSNFSYHLEQLTGHFVRQTGDRYALTWAGLRVVRAMIAGTITNIEHVPPTEVDAQCPLCGSPVELLYTSQICTIRCSSCPGIAPERSGAGNLFQSAVPPVGLADRPLEETFQAAVTFGLNRISAQRRGICPQCAGAVDATIDVCDDHHPTDDGVCPRCGRYCLSGLHYGCSKCREGRHTPTRIPLFSVPTVVARYETHGIDHEFASWASFGRAIQAEETLIEDDPVRLRFELPEIPTDNVIDVDETLTPLDP